MAKRKRRDVKEHRMWKMLSVLRNGPRLAVLSYSIQTFDGDLEKERELMLLAAAVDYVRDHGDIMEEYIVDASCNGFRFQMRLDEMPYLGGRDPSPVDGMTRH